MNNPCKFQCKLYLCYDDDDGDYIDYLIVLCPELDQVGIPRTSSEQWVETFLCDSGDGLRETLGLPDDKASYHVLFSGSLQCSRTGYLEEYVEELTIDEGVQFVVLPDDYYRAPGPDYNEDSEQNATPRMPLL
jgi:hypothetical protein